MNRSWAADPPAGRGGHIYPGPGSVTALPGVADELAPMVGVWERLLTLHLPDRSGRCRTCTQGGTGLPGTLWPCALHGIAELARRRHGRARGA
jgi:hypothetical protein